MSTVADYNNNPGNLKPQGFTYKDQIGVDDRGFAIFATKEAGRNALIQDIQIKQKKGINTPQSFIDKYAPAGSENSEESRDNYKIGMAGHLGLKNTNSPFPENSAEKIADFITSFERGSQTTQEAPKADPNNPFAAGVPLADKARQASTTEGTTDTTPPAEDFVDPATAAGVGALVSGVGQLGSQPEYFGPPPDINEIKESARSKISALEESGNKTIAALQEAEDKALRRHQIAADRLQKRMSNPSPIAGGQTLADLELDFKISQYALQSADRELKARLAEQKAKVPATPAATTQNVLQTGSMASATPQIITDPNAPVQTSQERILQGKIDPTTGNTGRQNMVFNEVTSWEANERELQQKALKEAQKAGLIPDTGQQVRSQFGKPSGTASGLLVKPEVGEPLKQQAELEQRIADDKAAQERLAQQNEMDRLKEERALAAQRSSQAQSALTKAQSARTSGVTRAQTAAETAEDRALAARQDLESGRKTAQEILNENAAKVSAQAKADVKAAKAAPSGFGRYVANTGVAIGKTGLLNPVGRTTIGAIGGLQAARGINELANMPIEELIKRYQAGERSPELLAAIQQAAGATAQTGFGAAATMPVFGPKTAKIKGAGALGTLGMGLYEGYKAFNEPNKVAP
jgi:hypothetical protein